ncbi:MAG TPA: ferritin-like protein [Thermoanaerobaculia bacterium]|nr:ferritin-like protein [Thermoanaerobaculia bacterium]
MQKLMTVPEEVRDRAWVLEALQEAVELEFSTVAPYLYAMWSIDPARDPDRVARMLRRIAVEEMLHMGLACNLLAGLGASPLIASRVPVYPGKLKAGVHADLTVGLEPLTKTLLLKAFMVIEEPETIVAEEPDFKPTGDKLISAFYGAIKEAISKESLSFNPANQIDLRGFFDDSPAPVRTPAEANAAIEFILQQGEGSGGSPFEADPDTPSHFYLFGELFHSRKLTRQPPFTYTGGEVRMPDLRLTVSNPVPGSEHLNFNQAFSGMLRQLEQAWQAPPNPDALSDAISQMFQLSTLAGELITVHKTGPTFQHVPAVELLGLAQAEAKALPLVTNRFAQVKQILDDVVQGEDIGAHGPFWRGLTRDQFVAKKVFGRALVVVGDGPGSNLVKALRGLSPFGSDTGTGGAVFRRMPAGRPPVGTAEIEFIEAWINDGCPEDPLPEVRLSFTTGAAVTAEQHNAFWRELDAWSLFRATEEVQEAEGVVFDLVNSWFAFAKDATQEAQWLAATRQPAVETAVNMLSDRQLQTVESHYGTPLPLLAVLDAFQQFGADTLPADPLRPSDPRHRMNGASLWFVWGAFAEASISLGISTEFWRFLTRAILCGLLNDGVFRGRFTVHGFSATPEGKLEILAHVQQLTDEDLQVEVRQRFAESGL